MSLDTHETIPVDIPSSNSYAIALINMEIEKCTEEQKNIIVHVYDKAKEVVESISQIADMASVVKIVKMIGEIIKLLESVTINNVKVSGKNKKYIAILLTKKLLCECIKHNETLTHMLDMYDSVSDQVLETMVDVSRNLNVAVQEIASSCCKSVVSSCGVSCITSLLKR